MFTGWVNLTWFSEVPHGSHYRPLLLLGNRPVEERLPQMVQAASIPPQTSQSLVYPAPALRSLGPHQSLKQGCLSWKEEAEVHGRKRRCSGSHKSASLVLGKHTALGVVSGTLGEGEARVSDCCCPLTQVSANQRLKEVGG